MTYYKLAKGQYTNLSQYLGYHWVEGLLYTAHGVI
jgi:hypothetical protein